MDEIQSLMQGFVVALSFKNLALMFVGIVLGVIIGVLPGLGGANGVAILLPLTFSMAQSPGGTVPGERTLRGRRAALRINTRTSPPAGLWEVEP